MGREARECGEGGRPEKILTFLRMSPYLPCPLDACESGGDTVSNRKFGSEKAFHKYPCMRSHRFLLSGITGN